MTPAGSPAVSFLVHSPLEMRMSSKHLLCIHSCNSSTQENWGRGITTNSRQTWTLWHLVSKQQHKTDRFGKLRRFHHNHFLTSVYWHRLLYLCVFKWIWLRKIMWWDILFVVPAVESSKCSHYSAVPVPLYGSFKVKKWAMVQPNLIRKPSDWYLDCKSEFLCF